MNKLRDHLNDFITEHEVTGSTDMDIVAKMTSEFDFILRDGLEDGRLAHFKHAIEYIGRKYYGRITTILYTTEDLPSGKKATVRYLKGGYTIAVCSDLSPEEKRIHIGHELGHILISLLNDKIYNPKMQRSTKSRELTASILCLIMHIKQSDYYQSDCKKYIYDKDSSGKLFEKISATTLKNSPNKV